jgi:hypothetical protein
MLLARLYRAGSFFVFDPFGSLDGGCRIDIAGVVPGRQRYQAFALRHLELGSFENLMQAPSGLVVLIAAQLIDDDFGPYVQPRTRQ